MKSRVRVVLLWYTPDSHAGSAQTGRAVVQYEWYRQDWNGAFDVETGYCDGVYS